MALNFCYLFSPVSRGLSPCISRRCDARDLKLNVEGKRIKKREREREKERERERERERESERANAIDGGEFESRRDKKRSSPYYLTLVTTAPCGLILSLLRYGNPSRRDIREMSSSSRFLAERRAL